MNAAQRFFAAAIVCLLLASGFIMSDSFGMVALFGAAGIALGFIGLTLEGRRG